MRRIIFALGYLFGFTVCTGQSVQNVSKTDEPKWEYLVVSFGKTVFDTPEKMMAYKSIGIENGQESIGLQSSLDILGRFGWELVSTIGAIGGDQQLVLKRKYDKTRSANEYGLIQSGKELYLKDLQDIVERTKILLEEQKRLEEQIKNKPELINLDKVERLRKREELRVSLENNYQKRLETTEMYKYCTFNLSYKNLYSNDIIINITIDLTEKFLISVNNYHGDEVDAYVNSYLKSYRFKDPAIEKYTSISINMVGFIKFNSEYFEVARQSTSWGGGLNMWF